MTLLPIGASKRADLLIVLWTSLWTLQSGYQILHTGSLTCVLYSTGFYARRLFETISSWTPSDLGKESQLRGQFTCDLINGGRLQRGHEDLNWIPNDSSGPRLQSHPH